MDTLILRNKARDKDGPEYSIEVLGGDSDSKDALRDGIRALKHHPTKAARRNIIDMLTLIQENRLDIKHTEHYFDEDGAEIWSFILQS